MGPGVKRLPRAGDLSTTIRREMFALPSGLVDAVLERLGLPGAPAADRAGLEQIYAAWCESVPFDNVLKRLWLEEKWPGRLPGSTPVDFFRDWIEYRTGGTCWAGNGALFGLLRELGFQRVGSRTVLAGMIGFHRATRP